MKQRPSGNWFADYLDEEAESLGPEEEEEEVDEEESGDDEEDEEGGDDFDEEFDEGDGA